MKNTLKQALLSVLTAPFWLGVPAHAQESTDLVYLVVPVSIEAVPTAEKMVEIRDDPDIPYVRCEIRDADSGDSIGSRALPITSQYIESRVWPPAIGEDGEYRTANLVMPVPYRPSGENSENGIVNGDTYECAFRDSPIIEGYAYSDSVLTVTGEISGLQ